MDYKNVNVEPTPLPLVIIDGNDRVVYTTENNRDNVRVPSGH